MNMDFDPSCCIPPPPDLSVLGPPPDPSAWLAIPALDCPDVNLAGQGPLLSTNHNHAVYPGPAYPTPDLVENSTTGGLWLHPTFSLVLAAVVIFCLTACTAVTAILYCKKRRLKPSTPYSLGAAAPTPPVSSYPSYGTPLASGDTSTTGKESGNHWVFNSSLVFANPDKGGRSLPHTQSVLEVGAKHPHFKLHHAPLHSASFTGDQCFGSAPFLPHTLRCPGVRGSIPCASRSGHCLGTKLHCNGHCPQQPAAEYQSIRTHGTLDPNGPIYEEIHSLDRTLDDPNPTYTLRSGPCEKSGKVYCCDDSSCSDISFLPDEPTLPPHCCYQGGHCGILGTPGHLGHHHSPSTCDTSGGRESGYGTQCGGQNNPSADGSYDSPPLPMTLSLTQNGLYHQAMLANPVTPRLRSGPSAIKTNPLVAYNRNSRTFTPTGDFV